MNPPQKSKPGRPKHVAEYAKGQTAQRNFAAAMKVIISPKKPEHGEKKDGKH